MQTEQLEALEQLLQFCEQFKHDLDWLSANVRMGQVLTHDCPLKKDPALHVIQILAEVHVAQLVKQAVQAFPDGFGQVPEGHVCAHVIPLR